VVAVFWSINKSGKCQLLNDLRKIGKKMQKTLREVNQPANLWVVLVSSEVKIEL
jgi:hypothetical protein